MMIKGKKGEIGTIILLLFFIGAIYVVNHPPQDNVIVVENGISSPKEISTSSNEIIFINRDQVEYQIIIDSETIILTAQSKNHFQLGTGEHIYQSSDCPHLNGRIVISK
jgi:hypothetical protein